MKKFIKSLTYVFLAIALTYFPVVMAAPKSFVIQHIEIDGLQHISSKTVQSYLPVKTGDVLYPSKTAAIVRALYKTGFFDHISLARKHNTLIIHVTERPTIGQLKISGNTIVQSDKLTSVMKTLDVAEGHPYNPAVLEKIKQSLLNQYYSLGRYNVRISINVSPMSRNRVAVNIVISEGLVARIKRITIIGNHVFTEKELIKQFEMTTSGLFTFFTQTDRYSEERLEQNIEKLRTFYMDHGYVRVQIKSYQAEVTPDRKYVFITIVIDEGLPYTVKSFDIEGDLPFPKTELMRQILIKPGERFSRQKIVDSEKAISDYMGDKGYLFSIVSLRPEIDDVDHTVSIVFELKPGKRTYVRHITFTDNKHTNDKVLRREVVQMEAAPVSTVKLEDSKRRLKMQPFLKEVDMSVNPVPEVDDQVDVNYTVKEEQSSQATFKIGYSDAYKLMLGAGLSQNNFLGTGNTLGINLQHSNYEQTYSIDYTDPYYTEDGISRTFNFSVSRVDPGYAEGVNNDYTINEYDLGVLYGIPVGQELGVFNRIFVGATYQQTMLKLLKDKNKKPKDISNQTRFFINQHGRHFQEMDFKLGFSRDSRDRAIFPTRGTMQTLFIDAFAPLSHNSLAYYLLNYSGKWYLPIISDQWIMLAKTDLGYGNGFNGVNDFPIFRNYFTGGINSVRGYEPFTLGPLDSQGKAFGGNILLDASLALIFPNHISDNIRTSFFVDAGNVYSSRDNLKFGGQSTNSGPIRFSVGLEVDMLTPFGPIELSFAHPFARKKDQKDPIQFALGANF